MALNLETNVKLITSGNVPTPQTLPNGYLAFGLIDSKPKLYGNVSGAIIDFLSSSSSGGSAVVTKIRINGEEISQDAEGIIDLGSSYAKENCDVEFAGVGIRSNGLNFLGRSRDGLIESIVPVGIGVTDGEELEYLQTPKIKKNYTMPVAVKLNGTAHEATDDGVIDLGTVSGGGTVSNNVLVTVSSTHLFDATTYHINLRIRGTLQEGDRIELCKSIKKKNYRNEENAVGQIVQRDIRYRYKLKSFVRKILTASDISSLTGNKDIITLAIDLENEIVYKSLWHTYTIDPNHKVPLTVRITRGEVKTHSGVTIYRQISNSVPIAVNCNVNYPETKTILRAL